VRQKIAINCKKGRSRRVIRKPKKREMFDDPEPPDEKDPGFREEMFSLYQSMGHKPEELKDPEERRLYAEWLKKNPATEKDSNNGKTRSLTCWASSGQ
jgi:hypothetical protein